MHCITSLSLSSLSLSFCLWNKSRALGISKFLVCWLNYIFNLILTRKLGLFSCHMNKCYQVSHILRKNSVADLRIMNILTSRNISAFWASLYNVKTTIFGSGCSLIGFVVQQKGSSERSSWKKKKKRLFKRIFCEEK